MPFRIFDYNACSAEMGARDNPKGRFLWQRTTLSSGADGTAFEETNNLAWLILLLFHLISEHQIFTIQRVFILYRNVIYSSI
jgi:hypothetical protein